MITYLIDKTSRLVLYKEPYELKEDCVINYNLDGSLAFKDTRYNISNTEEITLQTEPIFWKNEFWTLDKGGAFTLDDETNKQIRDVIHADATNYLNQRISTMITSGFDYEVNNKMLHFSYDRDDQQNFADTANKCLADKAGISSNLPDQIMWNGYQILEDGTKVLNQVVFDVDKFLQFYQDGALAHKNKCMYESGVLKAKLANCRVATDVIDLMREWDALDALSAR